MQKFLEDKNTLHKYAAIFVLTIISIFIASIFWRLMLPRKDFYNELWAPAYLLVRGQSPYNTASLNPNLPAAWLPMSIGFFFPLGWLAENFALQFWYLLNIFEIALVVYLVQGQQVKLHNTIALALLCFFYPLTLNHLNLGQFSMTATFGWIIAAQLLKKNSPLFDWISAFLLALVLSKPHLGIPALLGFSYHHYAARGGLKPMFYLWARIGFACLILCIPLFIAYPNWLPDMFNAMAKNPPWAYPSLFVFFRKTLHQWGIPLWILSTLSIVTINFWLWKKLPPQNALYWSLALAPLVTPYVGSWDFVILLPLLASTYINVNWKRKIFIWAAYITAWGIMARIQIIPGSLNYYFWWVPLWIIGISILVTDWKMELQRLS